MACYETFNYYQNTKQNKKIIVLFGNLIIRTIRSTEYIFELFRRLKPKISFFASIGTKKNSGK